MITPATPLWANYQDDGAQRIRQQLDRIAEKLSSAGTPNPEKVELKKQQDLLKGDLETIVPRFVRSLPIQAIAQVNNQYVMLVLWDDKIIPAHAAGNPDTGMILHSISELNATDASKTKPAPKVVVAHAGEEAQAEAPKKKSLLKKD